MPTIPQRIASAFAVFCGHYGDVTKMAYDPRPVRQTLPDGRLIVPGSWKVQRDTKKPSKARVEYLVIIIQSARWP